MRLSILFALHLGVENVVFHLIDINLFQLNAETDHHVVERVVSERPWRLYVCCCYDDGLRLVG